jgi:hypothetical protein
MLCEEGQKLKDGRANASIRFSDHAQVQAKRMPISERIEVESLHPAQQEPLCFHAARKKVLGLWAARSGPSSGQGFLESRGFHCAHFAGIDFREPIDGPSISPGVPDQVALTRQCDRSSGILLTRRRCERMGKIAERRVGAAGQAPHFGQRSDMGFLSEPQSDSARNIELVEVVVITHDPAPAPEGIAPISAIRGSDVCRGPLDLTTKANMIADVVFRAST